MESREEMTDGLLLLHAFPLDASMWAPQVAALSGRIPTVAPNFPGFGSTPQATPEAWMDAAADQGEQDDVVRGLLHGAQEFEAGHLAQGVGADADLLELAGGGGGSAPQEEAVQADVRVLRSETVRGERAPFPPGVGIREYGDSQAVLSTCWHIEDARKRFR